MSFEKFSAEEIREMKKEVYRAERLAADAYYALLHILDTKEKDEETKQFRISSNENRLYYCPIQDAITLARVAWEKARQAREVVNEAAYWAEKEEERED